MSFREKLIEYLDSWKLEYSEPKVRRLIGDNLLHFRIDLPPDGVILSIVDGPDMQCTNGGYRAGGDSRCYHRIPAETKEVEIAVIYPSDTDEPPADRIFGDMDFDKTKELILDFYSLRPWLEDPQWESVKEND